VGPGGEKRFLRHVVGVGVVADESPQERAHSLLMPIDKRVERQLRPVPDRSDQRDVVIAHQSGA
jgi:hypothetical protein